MSLQEMLISTGGGGGAHKPIIDAKTVFKLGTNGLAGAQNNTFVDSSPVNNTITRYGNVTQGTFTPYSKEAGKWSNYFNSVNTNALDSGFGIASTSSLDIGGGDFTIETWVHPESIQNYSRIINFNATWQAADAVQLSFDTSTGKLVFGAYNIGSPMLATNTAVPMNAWYHVAIVRFGSVFSMYLNGVKQTATYTTTSRIFGTTTPYLTIANCPYSVGGFSPLKGFLSNLRIVKGTALYTANFTPPTEPLAAVAGTVLLICQDNRFKDNSVYNHTLTPTGNVKVSPFSPYANSIDYDASVYGGSAYFDGNGDYLALTNYIPIGSSDFTVTTIFYPTNLNNQNIAGGTGGTGMIQCDLNGGNYRIVADGVSVRLSASASTTRLNAWNTLSFNRINGVLSIVLNGVTLASVSDAYSFTGGILSMHWAFTGYCSSYIITKAGTEVLNLKFNNAGIRDESGMNNIETVGDAKVSSDGTGVVFDGANDLLIINTTDNYAVGAIFSTSIEFYPTAQSGTLIRSKTGTTGLGVGWQDATHFGIQDNGTWKLTTTTMPNLNAWNTLVITRTGTGTNQTTMTLNGNTVTGTVDSAWITPTAYSIGCASDLTYDFNGTIKNLTITKG